MRTKLTYSLASLAILGILTFLLLPYSVGSNNNGVNNNAVNDNHYFDYHAFFTSAHAAKSQVEVLHLFKSKDMGGDAKDNVGSLRVYEDYIDTDNHCEFCTRVEYTPGVQGVAGMAYVDVKGHDLTGTKRVTMYVMGISGDEKIKFMVGGKKFDKTKDKISYQGIFKDQKFAKVTQNISLDKNWKKLEVDVSNGDLKDITHPFAFEITKGKGTEKVVFYLKYVVYDAQNAKNPVPTENNLIT